MAYDIEGGQAASAGQSLRELVRSGQTGIGAWCMLAGGLITEVVTATGPDWMCLDTQHGLIDDASMRTMVQAAELRGTPVFVRVPWNDEAAIMRALDAGAEGVIVPMVNSEAEARKAAGASRYPPVGFRSWGPLRSGMAIPGFDPRRGQRAHGLPGDGGDDRGRREPRRRSSTCPASTACSSARTTSPSRTPAPTRTARSIPRTSG